MNVLCFVLVAVLTLTFISWGGGGGGGGGSTVVKVLCYKSEGRWFDPSWCQWIFH